MYPIWNQTQMVPFGGAPVVAKLPKPMQTATVAAIKDTKIGLPARMVRTAVTVAVEEATAAAKPEQKASAEKIVEKLDVPRATVSTREAGTITQVPRTLNLWFC